MQLNQKDMQALCVPSFNEYCLFEHTLFHVEKVRSI